MASQTLPDKFDKPVHIAVIGGTGLSQLPGFTPIAQLNPTTPWGPPSSPIQILEHNNTPVAFLARHGVHHQHAPHEVPSRANIAALRHIGVRCVIAFSAVGSLQEDIRPMDFVLPDQVVDRTKGVRPFTFFEGGLVGHVGFADPFDARLAGVVKKAWEGLEGVGGRLHEKGTLICMEGPQFSTRAESHIYRSWGGSVINMSALPEAKLAREAEMAYQMICMATDYDSWKGAAGEDVDVQMVLKAMAANSQSAKQLVGAVLDLLLRGEDGNDAGEVKNLVLAKHWEGQSQGAVKFMTKAEGRGKEAMERVEYLFPGFWKE